MQIPNNNNENNKTSDRLSHTPGTSGRWSGHPTIHIIILNGSSGLSAVSYFIIEILFTFTTVICINFAVRLIVGRAMLRAPGFWEFRKCRGLLLRRKLNFEIKFPKRRIRHLPNAGMELKSAIIILWLETKDHRIANFQRDKNQYFHLNFAHKIPAGKMINFDFDMYSHECDLSPPNWGSCTNRNGTGTTHAYRYQQQ